MDFVLTSDLDWASEYCVEVFLAVAGRFKLRPTVFVTHESAVLRRAAADGRVELGIHPNFLAGSSHGEGIAPIITHVLGLVPQAMAVRCHRHLVDPEIEVALAAHGLRIDSNTCGHLQPGLAAATLATGLLRLPVFFEDDCHWGVPRSWQFTHHRAAFFSPGLKILNFHPFMLALNAPDAAFYRRHKPLIPTLTAEEAHRLRHEGQGTATFLLEALAAICDAGHRFLTLGEMAETLRPL